jgi:hypothetical protein
MTVNVSELEIRRTEEAPVTAETGFWPGGARLLAQLALFAGLFLVGLPWTLNPSSTFLAGQREFAFGLVVLAFVMDVLWLYHSEWAGFLARVLLAGGILAYEWASLATLAVHTNPVLQVGHLLVVAAMEGAALASIVYWRARPLLARSLIQVVLAGGVLLVFGIQATDLAHIMQAPYAQPGQSYIHAWLILLVGVAFVVPILLWYARPTLARLLVRGGLVMEIGLLAWPFAFMGGGVGWIVTPVTLAAVGSLVFWTTQPKLARTLLGIVVVLIVAAPFVLWIFMHSVAW